MKTSPVCQCRPAFSAARECSTASNDSKGPRLPRARIDLCGVWSLHINTCPERVEDDAEWEEFQVPGWRSAVRKEVPYFLWFRRSITIPPQWAGKRVILNMRGVRSDPRVYLDGQLAGRQFDGWTPFELDITEFVRPGGTHTLDLCCGDRSANEDLSKSPREHGHTNAPVGGYHDNSGPWLPVYLDAVDPLHLVDSRLDIRTSVRTGRITVSGALEHSCGGLPDSAALEIECTVLDGNETVLRFGGRPALGAEPVSAFPEDAQYRAGSWKFEAAFPGAVYWTPENPHLYRMVIRVLEHGMLRDESSTAFGFKEAWTAGPDFYLNGVKRHLLAGSTWPAFAWVPRDEVFRRVRRWKADGLLAFRFHNQPWQEDFLDAADEIGIMTIDEAPVYTDGDAMYAYTNPVFWERWGAVLRGMIRRDRRHASLIMWSVGNEILFMGSVKYCADLNERIGKIGMIAKQYDSTRLTTFEGDRDPDGKFDMIGLHYPHEMPALYAYPDAAEWLGGRIEAEAGGGMLGKQAGTFFWDRKKPLYIGEYLWCPQSDFSVASIWFGDDAYRNRGVNHDRAKYLGWIDQTAAFRVAGVTGMCPWASYGFGGTILEEPAAAQRVFYKHAAAFRRSRSMRVFSGRRKVVPYDVLNDSPAPVEFTLTFTMHGEVVSEAVLALEPGGAGRVSLAFTADSLPAQSAPASCIVEFKMTGSGGAEQSETLEYRIYPEPVFCGGESGVVHVNSRNSGTIDFQTMTSGLVVIDAFAFGKTEAECSATEFDAAGFRAFLKRGGRALVMEQASLAPLGFGLELVDHASTMGFPLAKTHPLLAGLNPDDLKWWAGDHFISRKEILRGGQSGFEAAAVTGGFHALAQTPLADMPYGRGHVVLMQLAAAEKQSEEPAAALLYRNALSYLSGMPPHPETGAALYSSYPAFHAVLNAAGLNVSASPDHGGIIAADAACPGLTMPPEELAAFVKDGGVFYWHMPDEAAFARFRAALGANDLGLLRVHATGTIADRENPLLYGISREDFMRGRVFDWDSKLQLFATGAALCFLPAAVLDSSEDNVFPLSGGPVPPPLPPIGMPGFVELGPHSAFTVERGHAGPACVSIRMDAPQNAAARLDMGINGDHGKPEPEKEPLCVVLVNEEELAWFTASEAGEYKFILPLPAGKSTIEVRGAGKYGIGAGVFRSAGIYASAYPDGLECLASPGCLVSWRLGRGRVVLDGTIWQDAGENALHGQRFIGSLLRNLGASFHAPEYAGAARPDNLISQSRIDAGAVRILSNNTLVILETDFECPAEGDCLVRMNSVCYPYQRIYSLVRIEIDGVLAAEKEVASDVTASYDMALVSLSAGHHSLRLSYGNDGFGDGGDRALFIQGLSINSAKNTDLAACPK